MDGMVAWEYALLVRRYQGQGRNFHVSFVWYGPDGSRTDITAYGDTAIAHLNRAGREGWELVSAAEDVNNVQGSTEVHRYHLKRPMA
ncbi:hypothetical protein ACGFI4_26030 [Micromonospora carbonacea]|jgi:hypothetical protein|uniref:DUF4177 domain-containing protein n=1 Tax=Micromonospora carbonacea TaxID=47853 RepID=A0A1C5AJB9_9ACTN|nr:MULTISPECIES: hypothetical protein [Micromonospora]MDG4819670.1 hypothetical protein [Micromonospora sp. WMMD956]QLD25919.1 hypothetical protein HXZ27_18285 [Micromonospora carbonacea]WFE56103.1 hypothetical protein O7633_04130 [Micromonospora sp. WMMD712]SCF45171.1 hypothetical protein GA0070563_113114 [Micromonospora carbonacea]